MIGDTMKFAVSTLLLVLLISFGFVVALQFKRDTDKVFNMLNQVSGGTNYEDFTSGASEEPATEPSSTTGNSTIVNNYITVGGNNNTVQIENNIEDTSE